MRIMPVTQWCLRQQVQHERNIFDFIADTFCECRKIAIWQVSRLQDKNWQQWAVAGVKTSCRFEWFGIFLKDTMNIKLVNLRKL